MTQLSPAQEPTSDWDTARDRAAALRADRTERSDGRRRADRWLGATLGALWIVSVAAHVLARLDPAARDTLQLVGSSTALTLIIGGVIWLLTSRQFSFGNRYDSPWTPLTKTDRRRIRRQLASKAPLELDHRDVVLELAHQRRRQTLGSLVILAIELPNSLGVTLSNPDPFVLILTSIGLLLFIGVGLYGIALNIRLDTPIRRLTQATTDTPSD